MPSERPSSEAEGTASDAGSGDGLDGTAIVRVDCGTAAMAELVRQIDFHGELRSIIGDGTSDDAATVSFRQPPGEPIHRLIDRLGSPPPAALVDAWKHQLNRLKTHLRDARLPLHHSVLEELRIDGAARLHVPFLPLQIAVSICRAEPQCGEQGSLAPWLYKARPQIDLGGIDGLIEAVVGVARGAADPPPVRMLPEGRRDGRPRHASPDHASPGRAQRAVATRRARWMWAGGATAVGILVAIALW